MCFTLFQVLRRYTSKHTQKHQKFWKKFSKQNKKPIIFDNWYSYCKTRDKYMIKQNGGSYNIKNVEDQHHCYLPSGFQCLTESFRMKIINTTLCTGTLIARWHFLGCKKVDNKLSKLWVKNFKLWLLPLRETILYTP